MKKFLYLFVLLGSACSTNSDDSEMLIRASEVVYGEDDRTDYYAESDESLKTLTHESIVSMMHRENIDLSDPNDAQFTSRTLQESLGLCLDERFADQITASHCSATLIDDDLVLTAGHCMTSQFECNGSAFVFNYYMVSETELQTVTENDVYNCAELLVQEYTDQLDYAIARLDRPVVGHSPATFNTSQNPVTEGDSVTVIGFGSRLPAKIDDGGRVLNAHADQLEFFEATTDTFGGNSGSGVFDVNNELIGILVRGAQDYYDDNGCQRVNVLDEENADSGGEDITYAFQAIDALCGEGYPSERLCNTTGECNDGFCSINEDFDSCPEDCVIDSIEGWNCNPELFGTLDGCDCNCGIRDPDCDYADPDVFNCNDGEICNENGACEVPIEGWNCNSDYFGTLDGCDCNCGIRDPDCERADQEIYNCNDGEICNEEGICFPYTSDEETGSSEPNVPDAEGDFDDQNIQETEDSGEPFTNGTDCSTAQAKANPFWIAGFLGFLTWRKRKTAK